MALDLDLFSSSNFRPTVQKYCRALGWNNADINDSRAILRFKADSGNTQTLFILSYDNTLEFSVPSGISYDSISDVPGFLSTLLLRKNANRKVGYWCIEELGGKQTFSIMHNAEISLINVDYFGLIVSELVAECDEVEQAVLKMIRGD